VGDEAGRVLLHHAVQGGLLGASFGGLGTDPTRVRRVPVRLFRRRRSGPRNSRSGARG
jgi:hypothetical protein